jgi:ring-1,2-phenylacetyl-CoA epoxidase subunit PaaE
MADFYPLKVKEVRRETDESVSIVLDPTNSGASFDFLPGQYLTFRLEVNNEEHRRSYSICSSPSDSDIVVGVKSMNPGTVSVYLNGELKPGDVLQSMKPEGNFVPDLQPGSEKHYVLFAAGSGITPLLSIVKSIVEKEPGSKISLFYGNTSASSIMFKSQLEQIAQSHSNLQVHHILTDGSSGVPLLSGRMDFSKALDLLNKYVTDDLPREFFLCGPGGMIESVMAGLVDSGVQKTQIHTEYFTTPDSEDQPAEVEAPAKTVTDFVGRAKIRATLDDERHEFELETEGDSLLDTALNEGIDAPFSCKGGVCTTCRAKLIKGSVKMDANYALSDGEISDGFILACQSHPTSPEVEISWDE